MSDDERASFAAAIHDHLELKRRNAALEFEMPLASYLRTEARQASTKGEHAVRLEDEDTLANVLRRNSEAS